MKKKDFILITGILLVAGLLVIIGRMRNEEAGATVSVWIDGELYGSYMLEESEEIVLQNEFGYNRIQIKDGEVWMAEADCPDGYCKHQGKQHRAGSAIVCLPHKLVVEVQADKRQTPDNAESVENEETEQDVDAVVK